MDPDLLMFRYYHVMYNLQRESTSEDYYKEVRVGLQVLMKFATISLLRLYALLGSIQSNLGAIHSVFMAGTA